MQAPERYGLWDLGEACDPRSPHGCPSGPVEIGSSRNNLQRKLPIFPLLSPAPCPFSSRGRDAGTDAAERRLAPPGDDQRDASLCVSIDPKVSTFTSLPRHDTKIKPRERERAALPALLVSIRSASLPPSSSTCLSVVLLVCLGSS